MMIDLEAPRREDTASMSDLDLREELRHRVKTLQSGCTDTLLEEIDALISELFERACGKNASSATYTAGCNCP